MQELKTKVCYFAREMISENDIECLDHIVNLLLLVLSRWRRFHFLIDNLGYFVFRKRITLNRCGAVGAFNQVNASQIAALVGRYWQIFEFLDFRLDFTQ